VKHRFVALATLAIPAPAFAQVPIPPTQSEAPITLDPGRSGNQMPTTPPPAAPQQPSRPGIVIVGPDGKVIGGDAQPAPDPSRTYVGSGSGPTYDEPDVLYAGPTPELHVVRKGDTLWDICGFYFNDPWQWPKIWSYNPQITNPHWIYPGDLVRLLPRGVFSSQTETKDPEKGPDAGTPAKPDVPPPARNTDAGLKQLAFVEKNDLDKSITIDGGVDEKVLLGINDEVYLSYPQNKPPEVGKLYSIYIPGNPVKSNGKDFGSYVHLLGTVRVDNVKQDKRARGTIVEANQEIERGAKVGPLLKTFKAPPFVAPKVDAQGSIVALLAAEQLIGHGEVIFIDLGKGSGLEVGNRMFVVRRGDALPKTMDKDVAKDDRRFPARALGQIVIVEVGERMSIGLVTLSVQEMGVGDLVMMQKSK
jgi:LysM domain